MTYVKILPAISIRIIKWFKEHTIRKLIDSGFSRINDPESIKVVGESKFERSFLVDQ